MFKKINVRTIAIILGIIIVSCLSCSVEAMGRYSVERSLNKPQNDRSIDFLRNFLKWYKTKFEQMDHHIHFVDMDMKGNKPYRINFAKTEEYLSILRSSAFFSEGYIKNAQAFFKKVDLKLQKTKQNDGTVDGLDSDLIMHSQEPEAILENLAEIRLDVVSTSGQTIIIKMRTKFDQDKYSLYHLSNNGNKYLIDKIDHFVSGRVEH